MTSGIISPYLTRSNPDISPADSRTAMADDSATQSTTAEGSLKRRTGHSRRQRFRLLRLKWEDRPPRGVRLYQPELLRANIHSQTPGHVTPALPGYFNHGGFGALSHWKICGIM